MTKKAKIKVIKKKDVKNLQAKKKVDQNIKKQAARKMVSNVSSWVNDFQKRKRFETKEAIESLFPKSPQTDGV